MENIKMKFNKEESEFLNRIFADKKIDFAIKEFYDFDTLSEVYEKLCDIEEDEASYEPFTEDGIKAVALVTRFCRECKAIF